MATKYRAVFRPIQGRVHLESTSYLSPGILGVNVEAVHCTDTDPDRAMFFDTQEEAYVQAAKHQETYGHLRHFVGLEEVDDGIVRLDELAPGDRFTKEHRTGDAAVFAVLNPKVAVRGVPEGHIYYVVVDPGDNPRRGYGDVWHMAGRLTVRRYPGDK